MQFCATWICWVRMTNANRVIRIFEVKTSEFREFSSEQRRVLIRLFNSIDSTRLVALIWIEQITKSFDRHTATHLTAIIWRYTMFRFDQKPHFCFDFYAPHGFSRLPSWPSVYAICVRNYKWLWVCVLWFWRGIRRPNCYSLRFFLFFFFFSAILFLLNGASTPSNVSFL